MTFTMKIQPIDFDVAQPEATSKPVLKSRLKRLFDRPFRTTTVSDKPFPGGEAQEFEPSSVCLTKMVQNFIEENNSEKQAKCGRNRCNCFNGNNDDSSDDESDLFFASDHLKSLISCTTVAERNLLADAERIVDTINKSSVKRKDEMRKIVNEGLLSLHYDSSICKSRWEKSPSFPAGEYEYIDVIIGGERVLIDVDFRSEFDIARQTSGYKALLQSLPFIFVGKSDRLSQIVVVVSEAAKESLKKRGMHLPPWRKAEYMRSKWLSSYTRARASGDAEELPVVAAAAEKEVDCVELELVFEEKSLSPGGGGDDVAVEREVKTVVTGLALLFNRKP